MSEHETPRVPMRRGLRILLVASLALNVLVIGLAIGAAANWGKAGPPRAFHLAGGPLSQALSREDRRAIGQAMRENRDLRLPSRQERRAATAEIADILRAEPFDRGALEAQLSRFQGRVAEVRQAASGLMIDRIAAMTAEERGAMADALERGPSPDRQRD